MPKIIKNIQVGPEIYNIGVDTTNDFSTAGKGKPADAEAVGLAINNISSQASGQNPILYENISITPEKFIQNNEIEGFPYKGNIILSDINENIFPIVIFSVIDTENFAPIAESYNGGIYIYAKKKPSKEIIISTIMGYKGGK